MNGGNFYGREGFHGARILGLAFLETVIESNPTIRGEQNVRLPIFDLLANEFQVLFGIGHVGVQSQGLHRGRFGLG